MPNGMFSSRFIQFMFLAVFSANAVIPLSDSLFIEGHYTQQGRPIRLRQLEAFLVENDTSAQLAEGSRHYRKSAKAIGITMWCVNLGIAVYQAREMLDAIQNQQPLSNSLDNVAIPLTIGGEVTSFVQGRLSTRSAYLLHKAIMAYNAQLIQRYPSTPPADHRIVKMRSGWYSQGRLLVPTRILYPILGEREASRHSMRTSVACRALGNQAITTGTLFLALAAFSYIEQDTSNLAQRDNYIRIGIAFASFGIINKIISAVTRNAAIRRYNEAVGMEKK